MKKVFCIRVIRFKPYSPKAGTGISSHELNQPGTYKEVSDTSVTAQFKAKDDSLPDFLKGKYPLVPFGMDHHTMDTAFKYRIDRWSKIDYAVIMTFNQYTFQPIRVILAMDLVTKYFSGKYELVTNISALENFTEEAKKFLFY